MKRYLTGVAALALGVAVAAGAAGALPAASAGAKVAPRRPFQGRLLRVDAAQKMILVQAPTGPQRISLASGVQVIVQGRRHALADLNALRHFLGKPIIVGSEPNGMVIIIIQFAPQGN
jgi:hypothetical protein